jgi:hypothetical protein
MKHFLFLVSLFLTINASAHHLTALGWCQTGKAVFQTVQFANGLNVETQYRTGNGNWQNGPSFNTPISGNTTTVFSVPQSTSTQLVTVRFRYKPINNQTWSSWSTGTNSTSTIYSGCSSLPIKFEYLKVRRVDTNTILVVFKANESEGENQFNIQVSTDGRTFKTIAIVFPDPIITNKVYTLKVKI